MQQREEWNKQRGETRLHQRQFWTQNWKQEIAQQCPFVYGKLDRDGLICSDFKPFSSKPPRSRRWREIESLSSSRLCGAGSARSLTATISQGKILLSCSFHRPWIRLDGHGFHIAPRLTKPLSKCSQLEACPAIASRPLFRCPWKGGRRRAKTAVLLCANTLDYSVKYCSLYFASCQRRSRWQSRVTSVRPGQALSWKRSELGLRWRCTFYP